MVLRNISGSVHRFTLGSAGQPYSSGDQTLGGGLQGLTSISLAPGEDLFSFRNGHIIPFTQTKHKYGSVQEKNSEGKYTKSIKSKYLGYWMKGDFNIPFYTFLNFSWMAKT